MEANKTPNKEQGKEPKKVSPAKTLEGVEQQSSWEKAAEMIAGNNQLMSSLLKLILSPFTLIAGAGLIIYLFIKNKAYKDEIVKLKEEIATLTEEKIIINEASEEHRKKYKKLKKVFEIEQEQTQQQALPQATNHSSHIHNVNKNKMSYLK